MSTDLLVSCIHPSILPRCRVVMEGAFPASNLTVSSSAQTSETDSLVIKGEARAVTPLANHLINLLGYGDGRYKWTGCLVDPNDRGRLLLGFQRIGRGVQALQLLELSFRRDVIQRANLFLRPAVKLLVVGPGETTFMELLVDRLPVEENGKIMVGIDDLTE